MKKRKRYINFDSYETEFIFNNRKDCLQPIFLEVYSTYSLTITKLISALNHYYLKKD